MHLLCVALFSTGWCCHNENSFVFVSFVHSATFKHDYYYNELFKQVPTVKIHIYISIASTGELSMRPDLCVSPPAGHCGHRSSACSGLRAPSCYQPLGAAEGRRRRQVGPGPRAGRQRGCSLLEEVAEGMDCRVERSSLRPLEVKDKTTCSSQPRTPMLTPQ